MSRFLLFATLLTLVSCSSRAPKDDDQELALLHLQVGTGYLTAGNYPQALQEFLLAEKLAPENPLVLNNLGLTYYVREKQDLAIEKLLQAIKVEPKYSDARNNLARIYIEQEKYQLALQQLDLVNKDLLYREPEKAWTNTGLAYFKLEQYEAAKAALLKAIGLNRRYCPAYVLFGRTLYQQEKYSEAASHLDKATAVCASQAYDEPSYYSALSYLKIGEKTKAKARMNDILTHFPDGAYAEKARKMLRIIR